MEGGKGRREMEGEEGGGEWHKDNERKRGDVRRQRREAKWSRKSEEYGGKGMGGEGRGEMRIKG